LIKITFLVEQNDIPPVWRIRSRPKHADSLVRHSTVHQPGVIPLNELLDTLVTQAFRMNYASARFNEGKHKITFIWTNEDGTTGRGLKHAPRASDIMRELCERGYYRVTQFIDGDTMGMYCRKPEDAADTPS
jgi:hypothetical protein